MLKQPMKRRRPSAGGAMPPAECFGREYAAESGPSIRSRKMTPATYHLLRLMTMRGFWLGAEQITRRDRVYLTSA